jgi:DNA-binding MarR family transcriptional regulator
MNPQDLRTLHLLEEIERNNSPSQRQLANNLNVSVGLVNSFVKRLASKGYFKITHIPKNRVRYLLTPKGASEKTRLTYEYIKYSYGFYRDARKKLSILFQNLQSQGAKKLVFVGANDLAEIAYLTLNETDILLVAILDDDRIGKEFLNHTVQATSNIGTIDFDRILITATESLEDLAERFQHLEIGLERIVMIR